MKRINEKSIEAIRKYHAGEISQETARRMCSISDTDRNAFYRMFHHVMMHYGDK